MPQGILRYKYREGYGFRWSANRAHWALWLIGCRWRRSWGLGSVGDAYQFSGMGNSVVGGSTHWTGKPQLIGKEKYMPAEGQMLFFTLGPSRWRE